LTTEHDPAAAIAGYREALRVAPTFVPAHVNLGVTLGMTGQLEEAALHFAEAVRLDPKHIAARQNLALTLRQLGRTEEAALHFAEAGRLSRR
ncbi:MAG TPA: tetratricopeptide repeat protein, partial [Methylomirabilota bacterium]|nr:tetratricopeptide repeat protein [Methylomirabilota bacterium]